METPKKFTRRAMLATLGAGTAAIAFPGWGADAKYPSKPVTLVVPFAAGGGTDGTARVLASALSNELGQPVVVENRPTAGGVQSTGQVAKSLPDGNTLLWANTTTLGVAPYLYPNVPYDPIKSFQHISRAATGPLVLVVNPSLPVNSVKELVAYAKAHPRELNFGSAGTGTVIHLTGELFKARTGIEMVHVPYKGNAPALTDVMSGLVQMMFIGLGHVASYVKSGKLRALAIADVKRHALMPELPTFAESGVADFTALEWFGLVAPAGIPQQVLERLSAAFRNAAASSTVRNAFMGYGYDAISETPESFREAVEREGARWKPLIKSLGLTA
jgi:tripartite-type tricarboxylate transporter receptor subunit TctC